MQETCAQLKDKWTKYVGHYATEPVKNCLWMSLVMKNVLKVVAVQMGRFLMIFTSVYHINHVPVITMDRLTHLGPLSTRQAAADGKL